MSGILTPILMLGMMAGGIYLLIHRCDILGFCDQGAAAVTPTPPAADPNAVNPATGLTKAQEDAQAQHLKDLGPAGNKAQREAIAAAQTVTDSATVQKSAISVCNSDRCKKNPKDFICVQSRCHDSVNKDLTKNVQVTSKVLVPKKGQDACGCPPGKLATTSPVPGHPDQVTCSKCSLGRVVGYGRTYYAESNKQYGTPYRVFRNRISFN